MGFSSFSTSSGDIVLNNIFKWNSQNDTFQYSGFSYVMNRIAERTGKSEVELEKEAKIREVIINRMIQKKYITYRDVNRMINKFYKDRPNLLKELNIEEDDVENELNPI